MKRIFDRYQRMPKNDIRSSHVGLWAARVTGPLPCWFGRSVKTLYRDDRAMGTCLFLFLFFGGLEGFRHLKNVVMGVLETFYKH